MMLFSRLRDSLRSSVRRAGLFTCGISNDPGQVGKDAVSLYVEARRGARKSPASHIKGREKVPCHGNIRDVG
jgi:hypothetical protein